MQTETVATALQELEPEIRALYTARLAKIHNRFDVDDLLQTTALKAHVSTPNCKAESVDELRHWILTIAKRTMLTAITREIGTEKRSVLREAGDAELAAVAQDGLLLEALEAAEYLQAGMKLVEYQLAALPPRQAQAVRLRYLEQLEYTEIAARMNVTDQAVRSLVSKGLAAVRKAAK